ncbi:Protocadherin-11 X-linked [Echinococcus granulosus]|uniref:Protocadherin 11 n=1 Tax=Echinococcus granulosus TaxID=6210 RepID=U6IWT9_ECHGR|nr:Protocadherin-11 X-linked [Echinococcus granulosus]EUB63556.1 Protocadherin-11 X-linked [Echinococcus granulosus]CDS16201.1 protocadherin 11 [Echinococcus granulosus]
MHQQLLLLSLAVSFLLFNFAVISTDFRAFGNLPNEFILADDTPSDHMVGKVQPPLDSSITFPPTSIISAHRQPWHFQIFRPHKVPGRLFRIDPESGELYTLQIIDHEAFCTDPEESECILAFQVTAQSKSTLSVPHFIDVKVLIVDRNDHVPEFPDPGFVNLSVPESTEVGARFPLPLARDPDTRQYSVNAYVADSEIPSEWSLVTETASGEENFIYSKVSPSSSFNRITGLYLKLQKSLDYETKKKFTFKIRALDGSEVNDFAPIGNRKDVLQVYIYVEDINDNGPVFRPQRKSYSLTPSKAQLSNWMVTYTATVPESKWIKDPILKLVADDLDGPANSKVGYYFAPATSKQVQEHFNLNPLNGYLFLRKPLDYELQSEYSFRVIATDMPEESPRSGMVHGQPFQTSPSLHTATAQVVITVTDTNDEAPEIEVDFISSEPNTSPLAIKYAEIEENAAPPQFIASIQATDRDGGLSGQVSCVQQPVMALWLRPTTAINSTNSPFQLDEIRQENGRVQYRLLTRKALDREDMENGGAYRQVKIICADMGQPPRTSSTFVKIRIRDKNDNTPTINLRRSADYAYGLKSIEGDKWPFVFENAPVGSLVTRLNASDLDEGENSRLTFSFVADEPPSGTISPLSLFQINEKTGDITTCMDIDREAYDPPLSSVVLKVKVSDNGTPPKSATQEVRIHILDENDNDPVFQRTEYQFHMMENLPTGYAVGEILVTDKDEGEIKLSFGMQSYGPLPFTIWPSPFRSGIEHGAYSMTRFILNTTRPLDREVEHKFKFTLLATDGPGGHSKSRAGTATATVEIVVENENDNDPVIIFPQKQNKTFYLSWREKKNFELLTINANDKDPSENPHIFDLMRGPLDIQMINYSSENETKKDAEVIQSSDFLDIEPTTGIIFLSRDMREEDKGVHVFKVQVTDAGVPPRSSSITFFVLVDDSSPRSSLHESNAAVAKASSKFAVNVGRPPLKKPSIIVNGNQVSDRKHSPAIGTKQKPRIAGDLVVLLALGLVFLLLIATLSLVVYFRYWKKQARLTQPNGNRGSLLFANQVNRSGSTCMKEIRMPTTKQDQWLCTSNGSIISVHSPSQLLNDGDQMKNLFSAVISSSDSTGNIYYKAKADTLSSGKSGNDSAAAYSSLSPVTSVVLKPALVPGCEGYLHPESQLAYYAQNIHVLGAQSKDRSILLPQRNTMDRGTFRNITAIKQQQEQQHQNEVLVIPPVSWDCQSRSDSSLKQEELGMMSQTEKRSEADVSPFCSPFA